MFLSGAEGSIFYKFNRIYLVWFKFPDFYIISVEETYAKRKRKFPLGY
jgi:hypothetical protein